MAKGLGLKPLKLSGEDVVLFPDDVARLRRVLADRGYEASDELVATAYARWSEDSWAAGWMGMEGWDDDYLFRALMTQLVEVAES